MKRQVILEGARDGSERENVRGGVLRGMGMRDEGRGGGRRGWKNWM